MAARGDSRDHLGMAVLQPTLEFTVMAADLLAGVVVEGLFLVFFGHPGWDSTRV